VYIRKNDLIKRLVAMTGKDRTVFATETVETLSALYESYVSNGERTYINVPYKDKDLVKLIGARYDGEKKKWYIPPGVDSKLFSKWL
jgi:hypothetical protein